MNNDGRNRMRYILYTLAGLYLLYTSYSLFKGLGSVSGTERMVMLVSMIAFAVIGVFLVITGVKRSAQMSRDESGEEMEVHEKEDTTEIFFEETVKEPESPENVTQDDRIL